MDRRTRLVASRMLQLEPIVEGNEGGETIVFVQGWPDDASLWDETVAALKARYRCVRLNMPNYDGNITSRWGYATEEIVDALVTFLRKQGAVRPVTLVMHDWGCYWGHAAHHRCPESVARVVGLDVAPHFKPRPLDALQIVSYQSWLLAAFAVGGAAGNWMTRSFAKMAGAPMPRERIDARMNYPYRNIFADLFTGRAGLLTKGYRPTCPLLFVYGKRKTAFFHSQNWLDYVRSVGGEVVELASGHWVTRERSFVGLLTRWLDKTAA